MGVCSYRHIVWDWNGTLLADGHLCAEVDSIMLRSRGLPPITVDTYRAHFGFPMHGYYQKIGFDLEKQPMTLLAREFMEHYEARKSTCALQDGALDLIKKLQRRGIKQSVLSAYLHDPLVETLKIYGLDPFFEHIFGHDDVCPTTKVEQGRQLLSLIALPPTAVLLIGDTEHDSEVARDLGVDCRLVANGHCCRERLEQTGYPVYANLQELEEGLGQI